MNRLNRAIGSRLPHLARWKDGVVIVALVLCCLAVVFSVRETLEAYREVSALAQQNTSLHNQLVQARKDTE